jgi:hypothetical protein
MLSLLIRILRTEGVSGAFKGFSANMINTFSQRERESDVLCLHQQNTQHSLIVHQQNPRVAPT